MATENDVQAVVEQLIKQDISFATTGGRVDQETAFGELREIFLTALALDPNAILSIIAIARDRTLKAVADELTIAQDLKTSLTDISTAAITKAIVSAKDLDRASLALSKLSTDIGSGFVSISNIDRAKSSIDSFLTNQLAPNVRSGGSPIVTLDEAKRKTRSLIRRLPAAHQETLRLLNQLPKIFDEFFSKEIRQLISVTVVEKSKELVDLIAQESKISPAGAATRSTEHLSSLLSVKRSLDTFFNATDPLEPRFDGNALTAFRAKPAGTGTPATVTATDAVRPVVTIVTGASVFDVDANGQPTTSVDLISEGLESTPAVMYGTQPGPFDTTVNNTFIVSFDQATPITVTFVAGATEPITTIVSKINTDVGSTVAFEEVFNGVNVIKLQSTISGRNSHVFIGSGNANSTIGFQANSLESGTDPSLSEIVAALNDPQDEYEAEIIDVIDATLTTSTTGVISANILTDGSVDFATIGVDAGDTVNFTSGLNNGLSAIILRVQTTAPKQIHLDNFQDDTAISYNIVKAQNKLKLTSIDDSVTSVLDVASGNANTVLGFTGSELSIGTVKFIQVEQQSPLPAVVIDTFESDVVPGDLIYLDNTATSMTIVAREVIGEPVLHIDPEVVNNFGDSSFIIQSFGALSFIEFINHPVDSSKTLPTFLRDSLPINNYHVNTRKLEEAVAVAINTPAQAPAAISLTDDLIGILDNVTGLQFVLSSYEAADSPAVETLLKTLDEHNMDRFALLIQEGFIDDALSCTFDNASFTSQLQRAAANVNSGVLSV